MNVCVCGVCGCVSVTSQDKYRWFLSSNSAIFMFWVSIRALFSKTSFFRCSFSYRQHNKQHQINKQQQKTNSCHVTPTQLLPLGLVSSSLSHFHTLFLTQSDPPGLSSGCCATSLQPPCWGRGLGLPRLHHWGPPPEACRPEEERRTKMHQWHRIFNCATQVCQNSSSFPDHKKPPE